MPTKRDNHRTDRVASRIHQELAATLQRDLSDPRLAGVVISHVEVTNDLSHAKVFYVVMGDGAERPRAKAALKVLGALTARLRAKLAGVLAIRRAPELEFVVDIEREAVEHLDRLLDEVSSELKQSDARRAADDDGAKGE